MAGNLSRSAVRAFLAAAGAGAAACVLDATLAEPNALVVKHVRVPARREWGALAGLKVAHLSDLHVGGRGWKHRTAVAAVEAINRQDVDLIAVTGDFIGSGAGSRTAVNLMDGLRKDVPKVAVFGNHDHVYGRKYLDSLWSGLEDAGFIVLSNEAVRLELASRDIWIGGVDDAYSDRDDLESVRSAWEPRSGPRILLTHYPDLAERLRLGEVQLSLAGHSHAGQVRLPLLASWVHRLHARTAYGMGLFSVRGNPLYVSPGIGMSGLPMRFRNLPEVAVLEFVLTEGVGSDRVTVAEQPMELVAVGT